MHISGRSCYENFCRNAAALREERGYNQSQLARALKIPQSTYAGYESGSRKPPLPFIKKLADFFRVTVDYLLRGEDEHSFSAGELEKIRVFTGRFIKDLIKKRM